MAQSALQLYPYDNSGRQRVKKVTKKTSELCEHITDELSDDSDEIVQGGAE